MPISLPPPDSQWTMRLVSVSGRNLRMNPVAVSGADALFAAAILNSLFAILALPLRAEWAA